MPESPSGRNHGVAAALTVKPASADDLKVGEVGLPDLVWRSGLVLELIRSFDHDVSRAGDEVMGLKQAID